MNGDYMTLAKSAMNQYATQLSKMGVDAKVVTRGVVDEWYRNMEYRTSQDEATRISSEDFLELMTMAVDTGDRKWFNQLSKQRDELKQQEEDIRDELGIQ